MSESVSVPAELVEALARRVRLHDGRPGGPAFIPSIIDSARALIDAVERPSEDEQDGDCTDHLWCEVEGRCLKCNAAAPPSLPDRDEAPRPSISDEAEELPEHEQNLRELWREVAEKGIEYGVDWPRIVLTLFGDIDRLAARLTAKEDDRG